MNKTENRILAIDSLRGGSAIIIACIYHLNTIPLPYTRGLPFHDIGLFDWCYRRGGLLVTMFLVISGYTSFAVYTRRIDNGLSFKQYIIRRMIRIFPLMLATLGIAAVHSHTWWIVGKDDRNSLASLILSCFGLQSVYFGNQSWNYPAWSLGVFFSCWIVFWFMMHWTRRSPQMRVGVCITLILYGMSRSLPLPPLLSSGLDIGFFAGGLIYYIVQMSTSPEQKKRNIGLCVTILLVLVILHMLYIPTGSDGIVFGLVIFPCLLLLALQCDVINKILSFPVFMFLGKISFSIYLCNYPFEIFMVILDERLGLHINFSSPFFFIGNLVLQVLVATIFWKIFEDIIPKKLKAKYLTNT